MGNTTNRKARVPVSISMLRPDWVRTQRAAAMQGMTLSEYGRAVLRQANALLLDQPHELKQVA